MKTRSVKTHHIRFNMSEVARKAVEQKWPELENVIDFDWHINFMTGEILITAIIGTEEEVTPDIPLEQIDQADHE